MANWIDVEKAKPKDGEYVLCYTPGFTHSGYCVAQYAKVNKSFVEEQYGTMTEWVKKWKRILKPKNQVNS